MKNKLTCLVASVFAIAIFSVTAAQTLTAPRHFLATTPILELGVPLQGALTEEDGQNFKDGSRLDVYSFSGTAGDELTLLLGSNDFDTYLSVFDPNGYLFDWNDDSWELALPGYSYNSAVRLYLTESGRYTVVVSGYSAWDLGSYSLQLEQAASAGATDRDFSDAESLDYPASLSLELSADLPMTPEGFTGPSRDFRIELAEELMLDFYATSENVDTVLLLYSADLELIGYNDDYYDSDLNSDINYLWQSRITRVLPAGEYYLVLGSYSSHDSGPVELVLDAFRPLH